MPGKYRYHDEEYTRVEVLNKRKYVIQAFVIMSEEQQERKDSYKFYRSYRQKNPFGVDVNPACAIAVPDPDNEEWSFYSAADMTEYVRDTFVNYKLACKRFDKRFGRKMLTGIRIALYSLLGLAVLYTVLYGLSINGKLGDVIVPIDGAVVSWFVVLSALVILPIIFPYIKGLKLPGFGFELREQEKKK